MKKERKNKENHNTMPTLTSMVQNPLSNGGTPHKGNTGHGLRNKPSIRITTNHKLQSHCHLLRDTGRDFGTIETEECKPHVLNFLGETQIQWIPQPEKPPLRNRRRSSVPKAGALNMRGKAISQENVPLRKQRCTVQKSPITK
jgi:hypothetical protein